MCFMHDARKDILLHFMGQDVFSFFLWAIIQTKLILIKILTLIYCKLLFKLYEYCIKSNMEKSNIVE
ncbi:hypothetical protein D3P07_13965 [Paenibacillus sp. 1011MAR3C5]|nr:hypothetical protein D3P07_13965 [Paenibacillus sp. 1011MAR3C5]